MQTDSPSPQATNASAATPAPTILLTATLRWPIAARLAIEFAAMGCRVEAVCPRQHPATKTRAIDRFHPYTVLWPQFSLRAAIKAAAPDLVIPCDDGAAADLQRLYARTASEPTSTRGLRALIGHSLGSPDACTLATARGRVMSLAAEEGVRIPATASVRVPSELDTFLRQHGFPAVLKADCTWGGQGVAIVRTHEEAQRALALMQARPSVASAIARMLLDRDPSVLLSSLKETQRPVIVQEFIAGTPANRAVACWQGEVLAGISVEALRTLHPTGPATVVRVIQDAQMSVAVNRLMRRLGVSGLWGVDFVLQTSTGAAYLVEMNPRATPICHLATEAGQSLPAALYTQLAGRPPCVAPSAAGHAIVAMFPGEWRRDPASDYLRKHFHDVPWAEPALVQDCIDPPWSERGLIARLWAHLRPRTSDPRNAPMDPVGVALEADNPPQPRALDKFDGLSSST